MIDFSNKTRDGTFQKIHKYYMMYVLGFLHIDVPVTFMQIQDERTIYNQHLK